MLWVNDIPLFIFLRVNVTRTPGRQALVVDPVVEGTRLTKVLMDGGSGLNLLYADTLKGMGIPMSRLSTSNMSFDAGRSCFGVGRVNVNRLRLTGRLECRLCGGLLGSQPECALISSTSTGPARKITFLSLA